MRCIHGECAALVALDRRAVGGARPEQRGARRHRRTALQPAVTWCVASPSPRHPPQRFFSSFGAALGVRVRANADGSAHAHRANAPSGSAPSPRARAHQYSTSSQGNLKPHSTQCVGVGFFVGLTMQESLMNSGVTVVTPSEAVGSRKSHVCFVDYSYTTVIINKF